MTTTIRSADGTTIAFDAYGDGPPLILVGGAFQHRAIDSTTAGLAERLGARFTVFHYDRRGRGDSTDTQPWAVEREVEDLAALVAHAGGEVQAYGMSSGGGLVLEAAGRGVPLTRLAVYEPPVSTSGGDGALAAELAALVADGRHDDAVARFLSEAGMDPAAIEGFKQAPIWPAFAGVAPTLVYDTTMMADPGLVGDRAARVTAPLLVIDGGDSPAWAREAAEAVAGAARDARRHTIPGQTHEVSTDALAPVLEDWFLGRQS
ncbi:MAG TPA: alpha/beta hydrolase [Solirubrobacteraceae bacterium]|nr:alpha/beta hydrolase [Solirubrobacteraceae bacterium]